MNTLTDVSVKANEEASKKLSAIGNEIEDTKELMKAAINLLQMENNPKKKKTIKEFYNEYNKQIESRVNCEDVAELLYNTIKEGEHKNFAVELLDYLTGWMESLTEESFHAAERAAEAANIVVEAESYNLSEHDINNILFEDLLYPFYLQMSNGGKSTDVVKFAVSRSLVDTIDAFSDDSNDCIYKDIDLDNFNF